MYERIIILTDPSLIYTYDCTEQMESHQLMKRRIVGPITILAQSSLHLKNI